MSETDTDTPSGTKPRRSRPLPDYAELHCLTSFSFQRGASQPRELVEQALAQGYRALAVTDECSLAGVVRAWEAAKDTALQLILGSEFQLSPASRSKKRLSPAPKIVLLAPTQRAYEQLSALITLARRRSPKGQYRLTLEDLAPPVVTPATPDLFAAPSPPLLSPTSELLCLWIPRWPAQGGDEAEMAAEIEALRGVFGTTRLWIAWERHLHVQDRERLEWLQALGRHRGLPLVAAGDVHLHTRDRKPLQDVLTCIRHGTHIGDPAAPLFPNGERHLRARSSLARLYPAALLAETLLIAERCRFRLDALRYEYPHESVPPGETPTSHLRALTEKGLCRRYPDGVPDAVRALIEKELGLFAELGYEHYLLTIEDIVAFARDQGILCQGRGSAANSAVCYALGITEVDPARMNLLFERFVSKERGEPPDIDVDFEHQRREEVIQYLYRKYGRERAALTATVQHYRRKGAVRDVGKALGLSLQQVDALSRAMSYWDDGSRLLEALKAQGFDLDGLLVRQLVSLVNVLTGFPRHLSQHVGGFVLSDRPLSALVPVENAAMPDRTVLQWDKDDLDVLGILKVDVLALGMLSALRGTLGLMSRFHGRPVSMQDIPAEDPATYAMIGRGETTGVFQIESRAQMSMLPRIKPQSYWDLVVEVAIVRPGPIQGGMVHPYLRRRQGLEPVTYPSPELEQVLGRTLGVPLFQEQVMGIAMVAAGFSPGEADQVRRSMAAWKRKGGLGHFKEKLLTGMSARGYTPEFAEQIFQQVLGFGSYGFPMSHAASFALLTYVSCWMRCHEPAAFCAALLNAQPLGFYAPAQLVADARRSGVRFRSVEVNASDWDCTLERGADGKPEVRLGLKQISGMPQEEALRIPAARVEGGPFRSVQDLAERARLGRKALQALAEAGAIERLSGHRHAAQWEAAGVQHSGELLAGTMAGTDADAEGEGEGKSKEGWSSRSSSRSALALPAPTEGQILVADYRRLGLTLGRHPLALLRKQLLRERIVPAVALKKRRDGERVNVAGIVTHRQRPETASGVVFATLEDETGTTNLIIWSRVFEAQREVIVGAQLLMVRGKLQIQDGVINVIAQQAADYSAMLGALSVSSRDFH